MKIEFLPIALNELNDAMDYYNLEFSGLGDRFKNEIQSALLRIVAFPNAWSLINTDIRKCILHKFPYSILYYAANDTILLLAIMHHHRHPDHWIKRGYK